MRALSNPVHVANPERGVDGRTTLAKARPPIITDGRIGDFWIDTVAKKLYGPKHAGGWPDNGLIRGPNGWTALTRVVPDGVRRVREIYDWIGGEGAKPPLGFEGETGVVPDIADAVDYRGEQGPQALIDALDPAEDDLADDMLISTAKVGDENEKRAAVEVFDLGGELPRRTIAHAQASRVRKSIKTITIDGTRYERALTEPVTADGKFRSLDRWTSEGNHDSANGGWWVRVADVARDRLAPKVQEAYDFNATIYRKSVVKSLPLRFPGGDRAATLVGWTQRVPQGWDYDEDGNLYLHYPTNATYAVIVVYNADYEYVSWFSVDIGGESIQVLGSPIAGTLKLYKNVETQKLAEYALGTWPANEAALVGTYAVALASGVGTQFSYGDGKWLIEQYSVDLGVRGSRTVLNKFDSAFGFLGSIYLNPSIVGFLFPTTQYLYPYVPKTQGFALKQGKILYGLGGVYNPAVDGPVSSRVSHFGVAEIGLDGSVLRYGACKAEKVIEKVNSLGYYSNRSESEGLSIHPNGQVHHLLLTGLPADPNATENGILIVREFDPFGDSWADAASDYTPFDWARLSRGIYPRSVGGGVLDPFTRTQFTTMEQVLDFLTISQLPRFQFSTAATGISLLNDMVGLSGNHIVTIENISNDLFHVTLDGITATPWTGSIDYRVVKQSDVWRALQRGDGSFALRLGGRQNLGDATTIARLTVPHADATEEDILSFQAASTGSSTQHLYGGGSTVMNAATLHKFYCATTVTQLQGLDTFQIFNTFVQPGRDNEVRLGGPSNRWSQAYIAVGTINTSDARLKTEVTPLSPAELAAAAALAREIGTFQFLASVAEKGEAARRHVGMTVQRAIEIMLAHGLDPMRDGFICYDEWNATPAELDEEGNEIAPAREAGSLYSFRPDELLFFIARGQAQRQDEQEARLSALESNSGSR